MSAAVSGQAIAADVLLVAAVVIVAVSTAGLVAMHTVYRKAHYLTPISLVAPVLVAVAVTVRSGYVENTGQTWLAVAIVAVAGPILCHAIVRTARIRERGDWRGVDNLDVTREQQ